MFTGLKVLKDKIKEQSKDNDGGVAEDLPQWVLDKIYNVWGNNVDRKVNNLQSRTNVSIGGSTIRTDGVKTGQVKQISTVSNNVNMSRFIGLKFLIKILSLIGCTNAVRFLMYNRC